MARKEVCPFKGKVLRDAPDRARKIFRVLRRDYPDAHIALNYSNPLELLVATILSAQSMDKKINEITPALFRKYRTAEDYASARPRVLEREIRESGFYRNKAKSIIKCCTMLVEKFDSRVPDTMEELVQLPGIGRKSANVLLGGPFHKPAIPVDTHVIRLSCRLGLTRESDPVKIEFDLQKLLPEQNWTLFANALTWHGRAICIARKPNCPECAMNKFCPSAFRIR